MDDMEHLAIGVPCIVFGEQNQPDKVFSVIHPEGMHDRYGIVICEMKDGHEYEYGQSVKHEDVDGAYAGLLFYKRASSFSINGRRHRDRQRQARVLLPGLQADNLRRSRGSSAEEKKPARAYRMEP